MQLRGPKGKIARRLGVAITPKTAKILERRPNPPGQHGEARSRKESNYKKQLVEKQRLRAQYNVSERQLRNIFAEAARHHGNTGEELLKLLECRLDAMVLRAGFARTIFGARQLVTHGHVAVNGKRNSFPSSTLNVGDTFTVSEKARNIPQVVMSHENVRLPAYLEGSGWNCKLREAPTAAHIPVICQIPLVIEHFSR
jgi:small subunit ribosomal protein S4